MTEGIKVINIRDNFGRRSGLDRRRIYTPNYMKERRSGEDRRIGTDRRGSSDRREEQDRIERSKSNVGNNRQAEWFKRSGVDRRDFMIS